MGGGTRPWLGNPIKVKVTAVGTDIILTPEPEAGPSDLKVGDEYVVVFHRLDDGDPDRPGQH